MAFDLIRELFFTEMKLINKPFLLVLLLLPFTEAFSQHNDTLNDVLDSLYIAEVENIKGPEKVLHAEPLFIDLIRDLGARKGEQEWNIGAGITDNNTYDSYDALIEYEFAPINRLGVEFELPFTFYFANPNDTMKNKPSSKLNGIKAALQWSFYVSEKNSTSLAIGYLNEFTLPAFDNYTNGLSINGNIYNPFFVAAKRWGNNLHTLIYTGPEFDQHFDSHKTTTKFTFNTNIHYMISGTRNFIGAEFNKEFLKNDFDMTIRPQMRLGIAENLLVGIVAGIPIKRENQRLSTFIRLIYEPKHIKKHS
jgi:hypothetical protein